MRCAGRSATVAPPLGAAGGARITAKTHGGWPQLPVAVREMRNVRDAHPAHLALDKKKEATAASSRCLSLSSSLELSRLELELVAYQRFLRERITITAPRPASTTIAGMLPF